MTEEQAERMLAVLDRMDQRQQRIEDLFLRFADAMDERTSQLIQLATDIQDAIPEQGGGP